MMPLSNMEGAPDTPTVEGRDPIHISGNSGFNSTNGVSSGSGTAEDPYIIENLTVNEKDRRGIKINNTDAYFILRNCSVISSDRYGIGIDLDHVKNGVIQNCTVSRFGSAISASDSSSLRFFNTRVNNSYRNGFTFWRSDDVKIENSTVRFASIGLSLSSCGPAMISNSTITNVSNGAQIEYCERTEIRNVSIYNTTGLGIEDDRSSTLVLENITIDSGGKIGGIGFVGTQKVRMKNIDLTGRGIQLYSIPENIDWKVEGRNQLNGKPLFMRCNEDLNDIPVPGLVSQIVLVNVSNAAFPLPPGMEQTLEVHRSRNITITDLVLNRSGMATAKLFEDDGCVLRNVIMEEGETVIWVQGSTNTTVENIVIEDVCTGRIDVKYNDGITISNLTADNNYRFQGIIAEVNDNITIRNSRFNTTYKAIELKGSDWIGNGPSHFATISNCTFEFNEYPISISAYYNITIKNCIINRPRGESISIWNDWGGIIEGNTLREGQSSIHEAMINIAHSSDIRTRNNTIDTSEHAGITIYYSERSDAVDNTINNCETGILTIFSTAIDIKGNDIEKMVTGITLRDSNLSRVEENNVSGCENGILLRRTYNDTISGNRLERNDIGYHVLDSSYNTIKDSFVHANKRGMYIRNTRKNTIYNNHFQNSIDIDYTNTNDTWNYPKIPGPNIVGGPYISGNYWVHYSGIDTIGDGIGDTNIPYGPGDNGPLLIIPKTFSITDNSERNPRTGEDHYIRVKVSHKYPWALTDYSIHTEFLNINDAVVKSANTYRDDIPPNLELFQSTKVPWNATWMRYRVEVRDIYGNQENVSWEGIVKDTILPTVNYIHIDHLETGKTANGTISIMENIRVQNIFIRLYRDNRTEPEPITVLENIREVGEELFLFQFPVREYNTGVGVELEIYDLYGNKVIHGLQWFRVKDVIPPHIELISDISRPVAGRDLELIFKVWDNIMVSTVILNWNGSEGPVISYLEPSWDGSYRYNLSLPIFCRELSLSVSAYDGSGNINVREYIISPRTGTSDDLFQLPLDNPRTGEQYQFWVRTKEDSNISVTYVRWWFNNKLGTPEYGNGAPVLINVPETAMEFLVEIRLRDVYGNERDFQRTVQVIDTIPPGIAVKFGAPENGNVLDLEILENDNIGVVERGIMIDQGKGPFNASVDLQGIFHSFISLDVSLIRIFGWVKDGGGNVRYQNYTTQVVDRIRPELEPAVVELTYKEGEVGIIFKVKASDNRGLSEVRLDLNSSEGLKFQAYMVKAGEDSYITTIWVPDDTKSVLYTVHVTDPSGNAVSSPTTFIKLKEDSGGDDEGVNILFYMVPTVLVTAIFITFLVYRVKRSAKQQEE
ncbi:MAG: NosD domain-containing protein [Thermoplasmatota archaeon]